MRLARCWAGYACLSQRVLSAQQLDTSLYRSHRRAARYSVHVCLDYIEVRISTQDSGTPQSMMTDCGSECSGGRRAAPAHDAGVLHSRV